MASGGIWGIDIGQCGLKALRCELNDEGNGAVATASVMTGSMERLQRCRYSATSGRQPP